MDIHAFWRAVLQQNREAIRAYFAADAVVNWHCTNEQFSVEEFILANCEYPGEWDGQVERVEKSGDRLITVTRVYPTDRTASFHVTSFIQLKNDKIITLDEYWADDGEAPAWRRQMQIGKPING